MQEVAGSIPAGSTISGTEKVMTDLRASSTFGVLRPHRLAGLGHRPFTAVTGVRIPLGTPSYLSRLIQHS